MAGTDVQRYSVLGSRECQAGTCKWLAELYQLPIGWVNKQRARGMLRTVIRARPRDVARLGPAVVAGSAAALVLRLFAEIFGAGPATLPAALAVAAIGLAIPVPGGRARWASLCLSIPLYVTFVPVLASFAAWFGVSALPPAAAALAVGLVGALGAGRRGAPVPAGRADLLLAAAAFVLAARLPTAGIFALALLSGVLASVGLPRAPPVPPSPRARRSDALRFAAGGSVVVGAVALWAWGRVPLDPTPSGFAAVVVGAALGVALVPEAPTPRAVFGGLGIGLAAVALAWGTGSVEIPAPSNARGGLVFATLGVGAGAVLGALRPPAIVFPAALALAALLAGAIPGHLPEPLRVRAASAEASLGASRARVAAARERTTVALAELGAAGGTLLRTAPNRVVVELDGVVADPATRAGAAERFAGTLAACATSGRERARLGGDELGLALGAARSQGFAAIDMAVPSTALLRRLAQGDPALERTLLHPSVRLLPASAGVVLRAGADADTVVEIVRAPWSDARGTVPRTRDLRATRATLNPGGVHVVALAATNLPDGALLAFLRDFREVYPTASLWLPPEGADTALLLGPESAAPIPWAQLEGCVAADRSALRAVGIRTAIDLGALALADADALAALPAGRALGPGLPASIALPPSPGLAALPALRAAPERVFADAPTELATRAESRELFLGLLRDAGRGDLQDAITQARALAKAPGGERALEPVLRPHLERARQAMARGAREGIGSKAWEEAETAVSTARAIAPGHAATRCLEGELAGARGQLSRAEEAFTACVAADPELLTGHDGLARARRSRANLVGAEEALRAGLRARPDIWTTAHNLGVFLLELGRVEEAERLLKQAVATQARDSERPAAAPYLALGRLYLATGRAELALAQAERASALERSADALAIRGAARFELRQPDIAEEDFRVALALNPEHILALGGLGQLQATRGEYELAAASYRAVLKSDPQNGPARENLARLARIAKELPEEP